MASLPDAVLTISVLDAYVFLKSTPPPSSEDLNAALGAFRSALRQHLTSAGDPVIFSPHLAAQTFYLPKSPSTYPTGLRTLRQSSSCTRFEEEHGAEVVLLPRFSNSAAHADATDSSIASPGSVAALTPAAGRPIGLAVFDMDSTLIDQEVIDELAAAIGAKAEVQSITERAMRGELDFAESLTERVAMLKGVRADVWEDLRQRITLAKGARELCAALKRRGAKIAVLSGGFQPMADWLKDELVMDDAVANHLLTSEANGGPNDHLTGQLSPLHPIIDAAQKRSRLLALAKQYSVPLSEVLCVGDGSNDLPMLQVVGNAGGVAVACRAKPKVQAEAPNRLNEPDLAELIWLFDPKGAGRNRLDEDRGSSKIE